jgi:hypothetical protein
VAAINNLVKDAKPGDHFLFYCARFSLVLSCTANSSATDAGHSEQVRSHNHTREDSFDEGASMIYPLLEVAYTLACFSARPK